ncbi:MAG: TonB family protein [Acidobacteria bacterium]|nr:TonB family protein [Acidobacteriota bacterium]
MSQALAGAGFRLQRHPDNFRNMCVLSVMVHAALIVAAITLPGAIRPKATPIIVTLAELPGGGVKSAQRAAPPSVRPPDAPKAEPEAPPEPVKPKLTYAEKPKPAKKPVQSAQGAVPTARPAARPAAQPAAKLESKFEGGEFSTGVGMDRSGGGGLEGFPFAYYLLRIRDKISSNWFQSIVVGDVSGQYQVTVFFRIQRDGRVTDVQVEESSGISSLDMSAQRAVYASTPMPPLPQAYGEDTLNVHFEFHYER